MGNILTHAKFVEARNYTRSQRRIIEGVVIHTMEAPEGPKTAENIANWFAIQPANGLWVNRKSLKPAAIDRNCVVGAFHVPNCTCDKEGYKFPGTSAHWNVDSDSIVQSVREQDIAWHAGPVNGWTIGVEHAGYARQTGEEWMDDYSLRTLDLSANLVAQICKRWEIPIVRLTDDDLKRGKRGGIMGHVDVTMGLTGGKGHTDPGKFFPWEMYIAMVTHRYENLPAI